MKDIVAQDIQAVIPVYLEGKGNVTMIYTREGIVTVNSAIKTVIRKLCAHYRLDIRASNRYFGKLLSVKNIIPLPLAKDKIYIQLKVRVPIGKDDGAMGYFNIDSIKKIKGTKSKGLILLENGEEIQCLVTQETIRKDMSQGESHHWTTVAGTRTSIAHKGIIAGARRRGLRACCSSNS